MDDARRGISGDGDEFEHRAASVGSDDQQSLLSLVLVLHETDGISQRVLDVSVWDVVLPGTVSNVRVSTLR